MDQVAFEIGGFAVYWYGLLLATGILAGLWTASRRGLRDGLAPESLLDLAPWLIIGAVVGARLLFVVTYWDEQFAGKPFVDVFNIRKGGLVFHGGLVGGVISCAIYLRWKRLPVWKVADAMAPSIALGQAIGRIGCLMFGCCYGRACDLPWAIHFPEDHYTAGAGVHPTQIYESVLDFGLYLALAWLYRRKRFSGQIFAAYLIAYAFVRSFVEFFRGDYPTYYLGGWATPAHGVSLILLVAGVVLWRALSRNATARNVPQS